MINLSKVPISLSSLPLVTGESALFLDRDGVINRKIEKDYVRCWSDFIFMPGSIESLSKLAAIFHPIIVLTNQRGVGLGLFSLGALHDIHARMVAEINRKGGRIDKIYFCPHDDRDGCTCRKPLPGMVLQAKAAFPSVVLERSIIVGDSENDILLGKSLGMMTVAIGEELQQADFYFDSLLDLARALDNNSSR